MNTESTKNIIKEKMDKERKIKIEKVMNAKMGLIKDEMKSKIQEIEQEYELENQPSGGLMGV